METDPTGQAQLDELLTNRQSKVFDEWEQKFLADLARSKLRYTQLNKHQKAVVARLYGWMRGGA